MEKTMWIVKTKLGQIGVCDSRDTAFFLIKDLLNDWEFKDEPDSCDGSPSVFTILNESFALDKDEFGVFLEDSTSLVWAEEYHLWTAEDFK